jgi:hypothetical protein
MESKKKTQEIVTNGINNNNLYKPYCYKSPVGSIDLYVSIPCMKEDLENEVYLMYLGDKKDNGRIYSFFEVNIKVASINKPADAILNLMYPSPDGNICVVNVKVETKNGFKKETKVGVIGVDDLPEL